MVALQVHKWDSDLVYSGLLTFTAIDYPDDCGLEFKIAVQYVVGMNVQDDNNILGDFCWPTVPVADLTPEQMAVLQNGGECPSSSGND